MSAWSGLQPYRFCVRTARPVGASLITAALLTTRSFLCGLALRRRLRRSRQDGGEGVLRPALAEAGEEGEDEQGQPPVVRALAGGDGNVEQAAVEGERDHRREGAADQRPQAAEEEGIGPTYVVLEIELAAVDPLDHAHESADSAGAEGRHRCSSEVTSGSFFGAQSLSRWKP